VLSLLLHALLAGVVFVAGVVVTREFPWWGTRLADLLVALAIASQGRQRDHYRLRWGQELADVRDRYDIPGVGRALGIFFEGATRVRLQRSWRRVLGAAEAFRRAFMPYVEVIRGDPEVAGKPSSRQNVVFFDNPEYQASQRSSDARAARAPYVERLVFGLGYRGNPMMEPSVIREIVERVGGPERAPVTITFQPPRFPRLARVAELLARTAHRS